MIYEVGKHYWVPCVEGYWDQWHGVWVVMGPCHSDAEIIGFKPEHWHVDPRFLPNNKLLSRNRNGQDVPHWATHVLRILRPKTYEEHREGMDAPLPIYIGHKRRVCRREMPLHAWKIPHVWGKLMESVKDCPLKLDNPICPHKGMDLSTVPVVNGKIVCPLHGLAFCAKTGHVVDK